MLRIIAFITMLIDHVGAVFFPQQIFLRTIGRIAFPIFGYYVARGVVRTKDKRIYLVRLLILGLISQYPYSQLFSWNYPNICFELAMGMLMLWAMSVRDNVYFQVSIVMLASISAQLLHFEYGAYGILMIAILFAFRDKTTRFLFFLGLNIAFVTIHQMHPIQIFSVLGMIAIDLFERTDFKLPKAVVYGFYPVHITILLIIAKYLN